MCIYDYNKKCTSKFELNELIFFLDSGCELKMEMTRKKFLTCLQFICRFLFFSKHIDKLLYTEKRGQHFCIYIFETNLSSLMY